MTTTLRLAGLLFFTFILSSCKAGTESRSGALPEPSPVAAIQEVAKAPSVDAFQLYSWEDHGEWHFSVLTGSGKLRSFEEVSADGVAVEGIAPLKSRLRKLDRGANVTWSCHETVNTLFPPDETIAVISEYCAQRGIQLDIKH